MKTVFGVSAPMNKAGVLFMETASGVPIAVRSWWYPAESHGYEFLYPRRIRPVATHRREASP